MRANSALSNVSLITELILENLNLLLSLLHVDVGNGIFTIEDLGDLLKGRALGLDEDEVDPDGFQDIPAL